ncbi:hypothetical protein B0H14DRAFT_3455862 [Mycena olivaceomarginata]|nr:hypothetical protein B0H14DRAFT_3455862 [Mycena olivaceomarginata]
MADLRSGDLSRSSCHSIASINFISDATVHGQHLTQIWSALPPTPTPQRGAPCERVPCGADNDPRILRYPVLAPLAYTPPLHSSAHRYALVRGHRHADPVLTGVRLVYIRNRHTLALAHDSRWQGGIPYLCAASPSTPLPPPSFAEHNLLLSALPTPTPQPTSASWCSMLARPVRRGSRPADSSSAVPSSPRSRIHPSLHSTAPPTPDAEYVARLEHARLRV